MKRMTLLFIFLCFGIHARSQRTTSNITTKKVYNYVREGLNKAGEDFFIRIAKRKNKWYLHKYAYSNEYQLLDSQLIANSTLKKFFEIKSDFKNGQLIKISDFEYTLFRLYPNYGYNAYFLDNIEELGSKENASDDELYVLGRAYSALYGNYCLGYNGFGVRELSFDIAEYTPGLLTNGEVKKMDSVFSLCIKSYEKIFKRNPNYNTNIVGSIQTKMYNEYMYHYMNLCMLHNKEYALKKLKKGFYDEHFRMLGENLLNACPQNAILFTHGDNDTYAALYMQKAYNIRPDVTIISSSLLGVQLYCNSLKHYKEIELSLNYSRATKKEMNYAFSKNRDERISLKDWLQEVRTNLEENSEEEKLTMNKEIFIGKPFVRIDLPNMLYRSDIIILDIIKNNYEKRPICSAPGQGVFVLKKLFSRMISYGMVYKFDLTHSKENIENSISNNAYYFFAKKFKYGKGDKPMSSDDFYGLYQYDYMLGMAYGYAKRNGNLKKAHFMETLYNRVGKVYTLKGIERYNW